MNPSARDNRLHGRAEARHRILAARAIDEQEGIRAHSVATKPLENIDLGGRKHWLGWGHQNTVPFQRDFWIALWHCGREPRPAETFNVPEFRLRRAKIAGIFAVCPGGK
jgi:hypothetical protein